MKTKTFCSLLILITLIISCKKDDEREPLESGYITVIQGPWEFELISNGAILLHFTGSNLNQKKAYIYFGNDSFFSGYLDGHSWSGENKVEQFKFAGNFSGNPADTFIGTLTLTDGSNKSVEMKGKYGKFE
jgi:hypothetical protein